MTQPVSKIIFLEKSVIDKIAAGEVVERPASVVKELMENSIDAGSTRIEIEIATGGKKLIKVSDNGSGMIPEDAKIAILSHTSSKIKKAEDLFHIQTLGFRGEALASIVAVCRLEMLTKSKALPEATGFFLRSEDAQLIETQEKASLVGTTVWVRDLFYNLPVRQKFLKKDLTELSYINDVVDNFILAYPEISFELRVNGTVVVQTKGQGDLKENLATLYGSAILENLKPVNYDDGKIKISGFVTNSSRSWVDRSHQHIFINRRPVKSFLINRQIDEVYQGILPKGRYPMALIFLEMKPEEVDVNIHPRKSEVRFVNTSLVLNRVSAALTQTLGKTREETKIDLSREKIWPEAENKLSGWPEILVSETDEWPMAKDSGTLPGLIQLANTYLIFVKGEKLTIIDQHAAAERINYEKLLKNLNNETSRAVQKLLVPETLELSRAEVNLLKQNLEIFNCLGFEIEIFGPDTFILRGVPAFISGRNFAEFLEKVLSDLKEIGTSQEMGKVKEKILASVACHSAVRAGEPLNSAQIQELFREFFSTANNSSCPHGRPTVIYLTLDELEKKFFRK